ncbi:MAG: hypothetical protein PHF21_04485 [Bacilli bacterium]|nr:hypothetical protein [Bacilli bacterium]
MNKEIIPLKIVRTKNGKTLLEYATPIKASSNVIGYDVRSEWFDIDLFDKLDSFIDFSMFDSFNAIMSFKETYNGNARLIIEDIVNSNGESIIS